MSNWVIVDGQKYDLSKAVDIGLHDTRYGTGVMLEGVYLMPNSKKVIVHTYSMWEDKRTHSVIGDRYVIADDHLIGSLAANYGCLELVELVPEAE